MNDTRILVEGSRGKSGIVQSLTELIYSRGEDVLGKVTGKEPLVLRNKSVKEIQRIEDSFLLDQENLKILAQHKNAKFKIFENQALSCYTMGVIHKIVKPQIIVIPNIRFEHQSSLGKNIPEIAKSFAHNFKGARVVITTENKMSVLGIFQNYCKKYKVKLVVIDGKEEIPSINSIKLINRILEEIGMTSLSKKEETYLKAKIINAMSLNYSNQKGIYYFNGSKVNDIESSTKVFNYLKKLNPDKEFIFVCYLRKDRPERTESFLPFFDLVYDDERVKKIYFTGSGLKQIKKNHKAITLKRLSPREIIRICKDNNCVLFMAVNGVNDFMENLEALLEN